MKIAVCDDDSNTLAQISSILDFYRQEHDIPVTYTTYHSSFELAASARENQYDIYLLDIIMPGLTGMELAKEIRSFDKAAAIIFLTTSPEFAVESYTVKAANYIMKPVQTDQLTRALDEITASLAQDRGKSVILKSTIGIHKIHLSNLMYVEAQGRKVIYYMKNGEQITCISRFSSVCDSLLQNTDFILTHRSFLVNMNYIRSIGSADMQLQNGTILPLAQRRTAEIKKHYLAFQMEEMP